MAILPIVAAMALTPPIDAPPGCRLTHILPDGRRIEYPARPADGSPTPGHAAASAVSRGGATSSVSVSASSSSSGGGSASASSSAEGDGRKVTTLQDESGCRIVVDDRAAGDSR